MAGGGATARVVRVLFFAGAKQACGRESEEVRWREGMTTGDVLQDLANEHRALRPLLGQIRLARNGEFAGREAGVDPGDEVALIPPVSGG